MLSDGASKHSRYDKPRRKKPTQGSLFDDKVMGMAVANKDIIQDALAVDAACSGNPGPVEWQGVYVKNKKRIFHFGPIPDGTNNVGEFLAIVHALAWLAKQGKDAPIYTDSVNAMNWVRWKECRTNMKRTGRNDKLFDLIERAETWLRGNTWENEVLKWDTKAWGEIPADFGRK